MPVAKNRKLAEALGISTLLLNHSGLPLSVVSASAKFIQVLIYQCQRSDLRSETFLQQVVTDHQEKLFLLPSLLSISFSLLSGIWQNTSPVAGFILSMNFPLSGPMSFHRYNFRDDMEWLVHEGTFDCFSDY